jgi:hypothetical protein
LERGAEEGGIRVLPAVCAMRSMCVLVRSRCQHGPRARTARSTIVPYRRDIGITRRREV